VSTRMENRARAAALVALAGLTALTAAPPRANAGSGVVTLADPCTGSSNPTFYANNHRMVVSPGGRQLALYDPDGNDVELAWEDSGGSWRTRSLYGGVSDEASSDRPASIATDGRGNAWVVWSGYKFSQELPVRLRRLTDLDAPEGPTVGPVITVQAAGRGNAFADLAFREGRGFIVWLQRKDETRYSLQTIQLARLGTDTPSFRNEATLYTGSNPAMAGTLVATPRGMRVVALAGGLRVFSHVSGARWRAGSARARAPAETKPSAIVVKGGILAAFQSSLRAGGVVKVVRFSNTGDRISTSLTTGGGYMQPSLAGGRRTAWLVMVTGGLQSSVVSRRYDGSRWGGDVTEISADARDGGDYAYPNTARRVSRTLRFLVDGERCPTRAVSNSVIYYERPV
jgi:hypothetical protein